MIIEECSEYINDFPSLQDNDLSPTSEQLAGESAEKLIKQLTRNYVYVLEMFSDGR